MLNQFSRQFIENEEDLQRRLMERDRQPDPDGRYRVNEFFCRQDTWQETMQKLSAVSNAVLMDLRGFSTDNQGCIWELEQLLSRVPLERVIFVVDETTDRSFLEEKLHGIWHQIPAGSTNHGSTTATFRLLLLSSSTPEMVDALVRQLFEACESSER